MPDPGNADVETRRSLPSGIPQTVGSSIMRNRDRPGGMDIGLTFFVLPTQEQMWIIVGRVGRGGKDR